MVKPTNTIATRGTTKRNQIAFMWHLYKEGFKPKEIARIYGIKATTVQVTLDTYTKKLTA